MLGQFFLVINVGDYYLKDEDKDYKKNGDVDEGQKIFYYFRVLLKEGFFFDYFYFLMINNSYYLVNYFS